MPWLVSVVGGTMELHIVQYICSSVAYIPWPYIVGASV